MTCAASDLRKLYSNVNLLRQVNETLIGEAYAQLSGLSDSMHVEAATTLFLLSLLIIVYTISI